MRNTIILLTAALSMIAAACSAQAPAGGVGPFWSLFRQAVVSADKDAVAAVTRFPFEVLGVDDSEPSQFLNRTDFMEHYERLVVQPVYIPSGDQIIAKSMRELIHEQKDPPAADPPGGDTMRFHQFEFERIDGAWRFVRAYLEE